VTNLNIRTTCPPLTFPVNHVQAHRQALERLYERKQMLEELIQSLEAYARCRAAAPVTRIPSQGN
jgi:hypothetical protein